MTQHTVIETGGKQYRVKAGDVILVESLGKEAGANVIFDKVLLIEQDGGIIAGSPMVAKASVHATVVENLRGDKVLIFKMRRRKKSRRTHGHRQSLTRLRIDSIDSGSAAPTTSPQGVA